MTAKINISKEKQNKIMKSEFNNFKDKTKEENKTKKIIKTIQHKITIKKKNLNKPKYQPTKQQLLKQH